MFYLSLKRSWVHFPVNLVTVLWREEGYTMKYCLCTRDFPRAQAMFHRIPRLDFLSPSPAMLVRDQHTLPMCRTHARYIHHETLCDILSQTLGQKPSELVAPWVCLQNPWRVFKILPRESIEYSRESLWGLHSLKIITRVFRYLQISSVIKSLRRSPGDLFTINLEISKKPDHFTVNYSNQAPFYCKHFW